MMASPPRLFGTNGIREVVGETLTPAFVAQVAGAIGTVLPPRSRVAVGWDGRTSSPGFSRIVSGTLSLAGHHVLELGLLPTPAVQYSVPRVHAALGVIVTASHNPPEFNGIKCIAADGLEVARDVEEAIERGVAQEAAPAARYGAVGEISSDPQARDRYLDGVLEQIDRDRVAARKFVVALDCGNGASVPTSPLLVRRLGCRGVTLNGQIDGTFPGRPSEPTEANVAELRRFVPSIGADLGVAHDGDADRAAFVDDQGTFVPGEQVLTVLARDAVERAHGGVVVTPVTGSQALEDAIAPLGGKVEYTRVGSPAVTRAMQRTSAVFGGEENGGLIHPNFQLARDGAMSLAAVLNLMARTGRSLRELVSEVPRYALVREKVACPANRSDRVLRRVADQLGRESERVVTLDGVKAYFSDGWLLLRPSGTEPIFRVFAESKSAERARTLAARGVGLVNAALAA